MYKMKGKSHSIPDIHPIPGITYSPFIFGSLVPLTSVSSVLSGNYWKLRNLNQIIFPLSLFSFCQFCLVTFLLILLVIFTRWNFIFNHLFFNPLIWAVSLDSILCKIRIDFLYFLPFSSSLWYTIPFRSSVFITKHSVRKHNSNSVIKCSIPCEIKTWNLFQA